MPWRNAWPSRGTTGSFPRGTRRRMHWRCRHRAMAASRSARARPWISAPRCRCRTISSPPFSKIGAGWRSFCPRRPSGFRRCTRRRWCTSIATTSTGLLASPPTADAAVTRAHGIVLGVRTADCLPVLFADRGGTVIGAAHAGWRGLAARCSRMHAAGDGRAGARHRGVARSRHRSAQVRSGRRRVRCVLRTDPGAASCFVPHRDGKWLADLYGLARLRLGHAGVTAVAGGGHCTMTERERFFSWRRDKGPGRMATLVWLTAGA